jgi:hypothetical protein
MVKWNAGLNRWLLIIKNNAIPLPAANIYVWGTSNQPLYKKRVVGKGNYFHCSEAAGRRYTYIRAWNMP